MSKKQKPIPETLPAQPEIQPVQLEPETIDRTEPDIIYDIIVFINALFQQRVELTQAGLVQKRLTKKIAPLLTSSFIEDPDYVNQYITSLSSIQNQLQVISIEDDPIREGKRYLRPGPKYQHWSQLNLEQQIYLLLAQWQESGDGEEPMYFDNFRYIHPAFQIYKRYAILQALNVCQENKWYRLSDFLTAVHYYETLIYSQNSSHLPPAYYRAQQEIDDKAWLQINGQTYMNMLMGVFYDLALINAAVDKSSNNKGNGSKTIDDETIAINSCLLQLTPLAKRVLQMAAPGKSSTPVEPTAITGTCIVQPNFDIVILSPDIPLLYSLLPFTQVKHIGPASTLQLTKTSVERGLESGLNEEQIIAHVTEHCSTEIPQNVLYSLRDWCSHYKVAQVTAGYLLEFSDTEAVERAMTDATFTALTAQKITPNVFFVQSPISRKTIQDQLEKKGVHMRYHQ
jgi:hypothetical protein